MTARLPIGIVIRTIEADPISWPESARRLDEAGYGGVWTWDRRVGPSPGRPTVAAWTIFSMAAASTRHVTIGTFVLNVMADGLETYLREVRDERRAIGP